MATVNMTFHEHGPRPRGLLVAPAAKGAVDLYTMREKCASMLPPSDFKPKIGVDLWELSKEFAE